MRDYRGAEEALLRIKRQEANAVYDDKDRDDALQQAAKFHQYANLIRESTRSLGSEQATEMLKFTRTLASQNEAFRRQLDRAIDRVRADKNRDMQPW
jgi:hypothetical protein